MKNIMFAALVIVCSVIIVISFFMPWAKVKVSATQVSKELVTAAETGPLKGTPFAEKFVKKLKKATSAIGELGDIEVKTQVSGYDIPTMVNKQSSKIAILFVQEFFKDAKDLDKKSMFVFLMPLLGIACMALSIFGLRYKWAVIVMLVLAGVISMAGLYNLYTANFSAAAVEITIERGIWQTLYSYLAIFIICVAWIISDLKKSYTPR